MVVRACDVSRSFVSGSARVIAIHGVTCVVDAGQRIALTGPSGSGKSTLLHLLAGLDSPTTGVVEWPSIGGPTQLRPGPIAIIFQAPSLMPPLNVVENVALPLLLQGTDRNTAHRCAEESLDRLALLPLANKLPDELSGGQAQRVAVARVLAGRPQLILADEPTGQLDQANGKVVVDALVDAANQCGAALVINTHDPMVAHQLDTRWTMSDGRLSTKDSSC